MLRLMDPILCKKELVNVRLWTVRRSHLPEVLKINHKSLKKKGESLRCEIDRERRILFRQNLLDKAERWYSRLPRSTRTDWPKLKELFLARYRGDTEDEPTGLPMTSQRISTLKQTSGGSALIDSASSLVKGDGLSD